MLLPNVVEPRSGLCFEQVKKLGKSSKDYKIILSRNKNIYMQPTRICKLHLGDEHSLGITLLLAYWMRITTKSSLL